MKTFTCQTQVRVDRYFSYPVGESNTTAFYNLNILKLNISPCALDILLTKINKSLEK